MDKTKYALALILLHDYFSNKSVDVNEPGSEKFNAFKQCHSVKINAQIICLLGSSSFSNYAYT